MFRLALTFFCFLFAAIHANLVYVTGTNNGSGFVQAFDTTYDPIDKDEVGIVATIPVGPDPQFIAVSSDSTRTFAYVADMTEHKVYVIDLRYYIRDAVNPNFNKVIAILSSGIGLNPQFVAVTSDGSKAYVSNTGSNPASVSSITVSVDAFGNATFTAQEIPVLGFVSVPAPEPWFLVIDKSNSVLYVALSGLDFVGRVDIATDTAMTQRTVGDNPFYLTIGTTNGTEKVFVANSGSSDVDVIINGSVGIGIPVPADDKFIGYATNGSSVAVASPGNIVIIDAGSQSLLATKPSLLDIGFLACDATYVYQPNQASGLVNLTKFAFPYDSFVLPVPGGTGLVPLKYIAYAPYIDQPSNQRLMYIADPISNALRRCISTSIASSLILSITPRYFAFLPISGTGITSCPRPCRYPYNPFNLYPPLDFSGQCGKNLFLSQEESFNTLTWTLSPASPAVAYLLFRNGQLIQAFESTSTVVLERRGINGRTITRFARDSFCYVDHNACGCNNVYSIVALDEQGHLSVSATITL